MLLQDCITDVKNYPHLAAAYMQQHEVIMNTKTAVILHSAVSDVTFVECCGDIEEVIEELKKHGGNLLETTNEEIYLRLKGEFAESYQCYQMVYEPGESKALSLLAEKDLAYAKSHYEYPQYLQELYERNRVFAYYEKERLIGYIAHHIDNSIGALYVDEAYRRQGCGAMITQAMAAQVTDQVAFAQVITDNKASLSMHHRIPHTQSKKKVCWMFNRPFSYAWQSREEN